MVSEVPTCEFQRVGYLRIIAIYRVFYFNGIKHIITYITSTTIILHELPAYSLILN
jgi:hypothetical protein